MRRFEFSLEKALRFRGAQLRMEEARYGMLVASEAQLVHRIGELRSSYIGQRTAVSRGVEVDGVQLSRLHEYGEFVSVEIRRLQRETAALRIEIEKQAGSVAAARQRVELLEKLRGKEWERWTVKSAKELQAAAEESFTARWLRDRRV